MRVSIEARRLNKEQFPSNLLLYSNISLCLCPRYCTSMDGINWLAYRPRAHGGVLPCKHFCLPTSAMLHYSAERLLVSYFSRTWRRSSTLHCRAACAPSTRHFKWSDYPRPVIRPCGWSGQGISRRKIATRSGSARLTQRNSAGMPATNACAYALLLKIGIDTATAAL